MRVDAGVAAGDEITPWFDPMIAKLIVRGADREQALGRLQQALSGLEIAGVKNNVAFLRRLVASKAFRGGELETGLIERNRAVLFPGREDIKEEVLAVAAFAELAEEERVAGERAARSGDLYSPWDRVDGWRLNADSHHDFVFLEGEAEHPVRVHFGAGGLRLVAGTGEHRLDAELLEDHGVSLRLDDRVFKARAVRDGRDWHVFIDGEHRRLTLRQGLSEQDDAAAMGALTAPMPGRIVQVMSRAGDAVKKGQPLLILEAMKMEHTITAPADGVIKAIHFAAGEQVPEGAELLKIE